MTLRGRLIVLFPVLMFVLGSVAVISFIRDPSLAGLITVVFVCYLLPPLCFRLHDWMCPLRVGREDLCDSSKISAWWGSQQFQIVYAAIPQLEILLRLIPGAYSAWLRLWGSRIGRGVYWAPVLEVIDRSLLNIGDHAFFGHKVALCSHTVMPKGDKQRRKSTRLNSSHLVISYAVFCLK